MWHVALASHRPHSSARHALRHPAPYCPLPSAAPSACSIRPNPSSPSDLSNTACVSCIHAPGSPAGTSQCGDEAGHCALWPRVSQRYDGWCDKDGCDYNPYRVGRTQFFGPGDEYEIDTRFPFTVVTQFISSDGTDGGELVQVKPPEAAVNEAGVSEALAGNLEINWGGWRCHV